MNYRKIYDDIINRSKARGSVSGYKEKHHIIPKSMGGSDAPENIVELTAREHYICHALLYKIHKNKEMSFAWWALSHKRNGVSVSSSLYGVAKKNWVKNISQSNTGLRRSKETREKQSLAKQGYTPWNLGKKLGPQPSRGQVEYYKKPKECLVCKKPIKYAFRNRFKYCSKMCAEKDCYNWRKGPKNAHANSGSFKKGQEVSQKIRLKISTTMSGMTRPIGCCIYCGTEGAISLLKRWHFDNCKFKGAKEWLL